MNDFEWEEAKEIWLQDYGDWVKNTGPMQMHQMVSLLIQKIEFLEKEIIELEHDLYMLKREVNG